MSKKNVPAKRRTKPPTRKVLLESIASRAAHRQKELLARIRREELNPTVSRQRLYQLRMRSQGRCWRDGTTAVGALCPSCLKDERERQRKLNGWKKRRTQSLSYLTNK